GAVTMEPPSSRFKKATAWYGYVSDILTPQRLVLGLGVLVLGVVGLLGGWGTVSDAVEDTPVVDVDAVFVAAPFEITVTRARAFDELDQAFYAEEGFRYIAVMADITNTTDQPVPASVLADSIGLEVQGLRTIELDAGPKTIAPDVVRT